MLGILYLYVLVWHETWSTAVHYARHITRCVLMSHELWHMAMYVLACYEAWSTAMCYAMYMARCVLMCNEVCHTSMHALACYGTWSTATCYARHTARTAHTCHEMGMCAMLGTWLGVCNTAMHALVLWDVVHSHMLGVPRRVLSVPQLCTVKEGGCWGEDEAGCPPE